MKTHAICTFMLWNDVHFHLQYNTDLNKIGAISTFIFDQAHVL